MSKPLLASIIITSYNYAPFLKDAINSALSQTYPYIEVIVVDDESTDNSRDIILSYKNRIISVLKKNGGQASALNEGFKVSQGDVIFFLDSDDILLPTAVSTAIAFFQDPDVAKVHWPLRVVDHLGNNQDIVVPSKPLDQGDLKEALLRYGPSGYVWQVTSGNAWARRFIQSIFPMPEAEYKTSPDLYLHALAPLFGTVQRISQPQGLWRIHGKNYSWHLPFEQRLSFQVRLWEHSFEVLKKYCHAIDKDIDLEVFRANSWWHQLELAMEEIATVIPRESKLILVDENQWMSDEILAGCQRFHFLEREGQYWGNPVEVARSLACRNHFSIDQGIYLWIIYVKFALEHSKSEQRILVFYDNLLNNWEQELLRLWQFLGKPELLEGTEVHNLVRHFIDKDLRHHHSSQIELLDQSHLELPTEIVAMAEEVYLILKQEKSPEQRVLLETLQEALNRIDSLGKKKAWQQRIADVWMKRLSLAREEIRAVIPKGETLIMVDEEQWGVGEVFTDYRCIPFLEKNQQYWGVPANDDEAISELERLRLEGANFIVFGWPAFWWLDFYFRLRQHLQENYSCLGKNDRMVIFLDFGQI